MSRIILTRWAAPLISILVMGLSACEPSGPASSGSNTVVAGKAAIGGPFTLIDHHGNAVSETDYLGRPQLIYFGFAYCPDICPTALQKMGAALEMADPKGRMFQPIFITVDPERDTPSQMALYITANGFPTGLIGLTGSEQQIENVKRNFAVYAARVEDASSAGGFTYDHSNIIYLMDAKGEFVDVFSGGDSAQEIADRLNRYNKTGQ